MEQRVMPSVGVVIVAGGKGQRMGASVPKQFMLLGQRPILAHTIDIFARTLPSADIVVTLPAEYIEYWNNLASRFDVAKHRVVEGGEQRFDSVKRGVEALSESVDLIAVHDGVRALCSGELIMRCVDCALSSGSAIPVIEAIDSFRMVEGSESHIVDRSQLRAVQTPQIFDAMLLRRAYRLEYSFSFTDDASVVEQMGEKVWLCDGERSNIKITTPEDLEYASIVMEYDR